MGAQRTLIEPSTTETQPASLTGKDLWEMGDIGRCELIEGELVKMSPTKPKHGRIESRIDRILAAFVEENDLGEVQVGEVGIYTRRDPDTVRGADVLFISHERLAQATPDDFLDVPPELVVEILSPNDRWIEVKKKLREYFDVGVDVVLLVNPEESRVSVYRSLTDIQEFAYDDELIVDDVVPGLSVPLARLFASSGRANETASTEGSE